MRIGTATAFAALAVASLGAAGSAAAADMPSYYMPPAAPAEAPLAFGSGWYLRGDASFGPEDRPKLLLRNDVPVVDRRGSGFGYAFGAGAGYQFTDWFRADVTADYLDPFGYALASSCGIGCTLHQRTDLQRWDGLVNVYVDIGNWAGFTPYVGAGVGVAGTHAEESFGVVDASGSTGIVDPRTGTAATSGAVGRTDLGFAWAAMAGVSYTVAPHTLLDIGYRYLDLGHTAVSLYPSPSAVRSLSTQQVRVGLRYMID